MNKLITNAILCIGLCLSTNSNLWSQNTDITPGNQPPFSPETIIKNFFIGEGVQILDVKYEGDLEATGLFTGGSTDIGIEQGIVIGTGEVQKIGGPSSSESSTSTSNLDVRDPKLEDIIGTDILKDVASYEITFIPSSDTIQFNYVFASEEYPEFVCSEFNDVFGFFITGPNPSGGTYNQQNLAIVPGTDNLPVSINNVNPGMAGSSGTDSNCQTLANLEFSDFFNFNNSEHLIFDGILEPFVAAAKVIPCETYIIRFSIADAVDFLKDSAVFLEGKSFSSNVVDVKAVTFSTNGTITEGCAQATLTFELPENSNGGQQISFELIGTAENGVDIELLDTDIMIPAGQSTAELQIIPIEDNIEEDVETLGIVVTMGQCSQDTIWIGIEDNLLSPPDEQGSIFLCGESEVDVDFTIPFEPASPTIFRNQNEVRIEPVNEQIFSSIEVENIFPSVLNQTDFIQVCIDELSHPWIGDLSIYLIGPDNQFIELSNNNGGNGGNGTGLDFFLNTCFTLDANQMINGANVQAPFIGNFLPEGDWSDFFGSSSYKVNGTWKLMLIDNFVGSVGTLSGWSIHFGKSYDINYSWAPNLDISCTNCPNPTFTPNEARTYTLDIEDTNGCSLQYEVIIEPDGTNLISPALECINELNGELSVSWEDIPGANAYQIRVDGGEWIDLSLDLSYSESNINPGTSVFFEVQAIGSCGRSDIASTICSTSECSFNTEIISSIDPNCENHNGGVIQVQGVEGTEPYTYQFGDIINESGIFDNLIGGDHVITVFDANKCQSEITVSLQSVEEIIIDGEVFMSSCMEDNGKIEISVTGGTGTLDLEWSSNFSGNLEALEPGIYVLEVTDEAGCVVSREFIIEENKDIEVNAIINQPSCTNDGFGSINLEISNTSIADEFVIWSNGRTGTLNENLEPGSYTVNINHNNGCEFSQTYEIESINEISASPIINEVLCQGDTNGSIELSIRGGIEPYDIRWSNGMFGHQITNLSAGTYSAIIEDSNGCTINDTTTLREPAALSLENIFIEHPSCNNSTGSIELIPTGGTPPYSVLLNQNEMGNKLSFSNLEAGSYWFEITDSFGCTINSIEEIIIQDYEEIIIETEQLISLQLGETALLQAWVINKDRNEIVYEWFSSDPDALSCTTCEEPLFTGTRSTSVEVTATDLNGCTATESITILVDTSAEIYVPNAFSPNGDGINDYLSVFGKESLVSSINEFNVYDRWGNQVSSSRDMIINDHSSGWNGSFKGNQLNNGVFVWSLEITFIDGRTEVFSGEATLIR